MTSTDNVTIINISLAANVKSDQSLITDPRMSSRTIFIRHENILEDVIDVFKDNFHNICAEHDFRLCSKSQVAPGPNGDINRCQADISRTKIVREHDMNGKVFNLRRIFTLFWKECLHEYFDGDEQKVTTYSKICNISFLWYFTKTFFKHLSLLTLIVSLIST